MSVLESKVPDCHRDCRSPGLLYFCCVEEWHSTSLACSGSGVCSIMFRFEYSFHFTLDMRISHDRTARLNAGGFTSTLDPPTSRQLSDSRPLSNLTNPECVFPDPEVLFHSFHYAWNTHSGYVAKRRSSTWYGTFFSNP
jgi:hypothetical protein